MNDIHVSRFVVPIIPVWMFHKCNTHVGSHLWGQVANQQVHDIVGIGVTVDRSIA